MIDGLDEAMTEDAAWRQGMIDWWLSYGGCGASMNGRQPFRSAVEEPGGYASFYVLEAKDAGWGWNIFAIIGGRRIVLRWSGLPINGLGAAFARRVCGGARRAVGRR